MADPKPIIKTEFSSWLNAHLDNANVTQIAASTGISASYLSLLRKSLKPIPSNKVLKRLAVALGVSVQEIFNAAGRSFEDELIAAKHDSLDTSSESLAGDYELSTETPTFSLFARVFTDIGGAKITIRFAVKHNENKVQAALLTWHVSGLEAGVFSAPNNTTLRLRPGKNTFKAISGEEETSFVVTVLNRNESLGQSGLGE